MTDSVRHYSSADRLIQRFADGLRALSPAEEARPLPVAAAPGPLSEEERKAAADLMRINHAGEVAAQGLYHGQALVAREPELRRHLLEAAREERDHLQWCAERLRQLQDHPSRLSPFWYAGSVAIGALAGLSGDRKSLGFVAETERQVSAHLQDHLRRLPESDQASRAVVQAMKADEERHGAEALAAGGALPPAPVRGLMRAVAGVMKFGATRF
jgi:ubiquinone biosynthesis monooxygenase Coq7